MSRLREVSPIVVGQSTVTLREFTQSGKLSLLQTKVHFKRHKKFGSLFYREDIALLGIDEPFEFYFLNKPVLDCRHSFPVHYADYVEYESECDQLQWLKQQYELYYQESASNQSESYFKFISLYFAEEAIWYYND